MKKALFLLILLKGVLLSGQHPEAVHAPPHNAVMAALGGSGIYTSIIYERILIQHGVYQFGAKAGFGISPFKLTFPDKFNVPVGIFLIYGKKNHHPEIGIAVTSSFTSQYDLEKKSTTMQYRAIFVPAVSYRFQKPEGGFMAKFGISPLIYFNRIKTTVSPWVELGVGWSF
jgi:hypothetical protein